MDSIALRNGYGFPGENISVVLSILTHRDYQKRIPPDISPSEEVLRLMDQSGQKSRDYDNSPCIIQDPRKGDDVIRLLPPCFKGRIFPLLEEFPFCSPEVQCLIGQVEFDLPIPFLNGHLPRKLRQRDLRFPLPELFEHPRPGFIVDRPPVIGIDEAEVP